MTYEQLLYKWRNRKDLYEKDNWREYIDDLWSLPLTEIHKLSIIIRIKEGDFNG